MAKKPGGLGRGFYDIFDDNTYETKKGAGEMLRLADIEPRRDQPRKTFEQSSLQILADSIAEHGVLQPIVVRENTDGSGTYEIIAGERRWRAAKMAGLSEIPSVVFSGDDLKVAQVSLIENIQREDLNPVEEALAYGALIDKFGLTQEQVAKQVGKSRSAITNMLRILDLPEEALAFLRSGELTVGHAKALLGLATDEEMINLANKVIERDMSVRDTENMVKRINDAADKAEPVDFEVVHPQIKMQMKELERRAMSALGRRVRISRSTKKKVVELTYDDDADLEALLRGLCGENIFAE